MIFYSFNNNFILLVIACMLINIPSHALADKDNTAIKDADYFINLAQECLDSGKYEEAVDTYKQAIKVNPDDAVAYNKLGIAYRSAGKMQESLEALKQAIKIKSDYAEAHYELGLTYRSSFKNQEALDSYIKAVRINPEFTKAYYSLAH